MPKTDIKKIRETCKQYDEEYGCLSDVPEECPYRKECDEEDN